MGLWDSVRTAIKKTTIEFKKINVGHEVRKEALASVDKFESNIRSSGDSLRDWWDKGIGGTIRGIGKKATGIGQAASQLPDTVSNINKTAQMTQTAIWVGAGVLALGLVWFIARRK